MKKMHFILSALACFSLGCAAKDLKLQVTHQESLNLYDKERLRLVPVQLYFPADVSKCTPAKQCSVAFLGPGYGVSHLHYSFIANTLADIGYLVVSVQHQLPSDPPFVSSGDVYGQRKEMWKRGARNIQFVKGMLSQSYRNYDWQRPVLIGHSNGGDTSAFLARESPAFASVVITIDSRRAILPRGSEPRVLSIRASDFEADAGVLPTEEEQGRDGSCVVKIAGAHHNDMEDDGSEELKKKIANAIKIFLQPQLNANKPYRCDLSLLQG